MENPKENTNTNNNGGIIDTLRAVSKFRIGCDYVAGNMFSIASPVADVI